MAEFSQNTNIGGEDKKETNVSATTSSVIAGQTWTRQVGKCEDPNCVQVHIDGQHGWLQSVNGNASLPEGGEEYVSPADRKVSPLDVLESRPKDGESFVYIVGTLGRKVTYIGDSLDYLKGSLEDLTLRSNLIKDMDGVENLKLLKRLELYDNQVETITHLDKLAHLTILDLSFNAIREMGAVSACPLLEELYVAQNKLRKIEGIEGMRSLKILDLGANRIRSMRDTGLSSLVNLESLWLGKNKIEKIEGIGSLSKLRKLDVQHNRLTCISDESEDSGEDIGITALTALEELYLAFNAIENVKGLPKASPLNTVDLSTNQISNLEGIEVHKGLQELWMTASKLATMDQLKPLKELPEISCLYLEHSPIAKDFEYRKAITAMLPSLEQLDATEVNRNRS